VDAGAGRVKWFSIAMVLVGNIVYHLGQRAIPREANAVVATLAAYLVAVVGTLLTIPFFARDLSMATFASSWRSLNASTLMVGAGIVAVELGYLLVYRAGWAISTASLVANAMLAVALLLIGATFFRDPITVARACGLVLCLAGLWLIARPASVTP
jgi:drug/metabolite transporter (DMT)-like permease